MAESMQSKAITADASVADARDARNAVRAAPLDKHTAELLTRIYLTRRINYQISFYQSRIREFDNNADLTFRWSALVMSLSTLVAAISLGVDTESSGAPVLRLATAILPALAAFINSFRQLYQWERQAAIYRDTILGLEEVKLVLPDLDVLDAETAKRVYPDMVKQAERVFQNEVSQWGQVSQGKEADAENEEVLKAFKDMNFDIFDENGNVSNDKLNVLREQVQAGNFQPQITVESPQATPALPDQTAPSASESAEDVIETEADPDTPSDTEQDTS